MSSDIAAVILVALAVAHSTWGEKVIVGPLVRNRNWRVGVCRSMADRVLRFAWHAVSVAWLGLAAALWGVPIGVASGTVSLVTGAALAVVARGHFAWPLFLVAGLYALDAADALPRIVLEGMVVCGVMVAVAGAILHVGWALGATWGRAHMFPEDPDTLKPLGDPGPLATLVVAAAAGVLAVLLVGTVWYPTPMWWWWATAVACLVATIRVVGDVEHIGFTKTITTTPFAIGDIRLYTPLFVILAGAAGSSLVLSGTPW
jgi:hypothetical protein